jgi:hypothetical protein
MFFLQPNSPLIPEAAGSDGIISVIRQSGVNIREVQELLGHKNVETTMIYTHVMRDMTNAPKSPLDTLVLQSDSSSGITVGKIR